MKYSHLAALTAWTIPNRNDRHRLRNLCKEIDSRKETKIIQKRYIKIMQKLRKKKVKKVLFLINENSKWKAQSLYDLMASSDDFEPVIAITAADVQKNLPNDKKKQIIEDNLKFFKSKKMKVVQAFNPERNKAVDLAEFESDIVFYQQPYAIPKVQDINAVSKYALTCYIPYYLPSRINYELECDYIFHRELYRYYVLNNELKSAYKEHLEDSESYSDNICATGHTMLDYFYLNKNKEYISKDYVIYAPHWSIYNKKYNYNNINAATFDKTGKLILEYSKKHKEINWVFKPHPTLKTALMRIGMPMSDISDYYSEWESFAKCCYDSDYMDLFMKSKALITDCGSFLTEYSCTKKPIIQLISSHCNFVPYEFLRPVFDTFYTVKDNEKLTDVLDKILVNGDDTKKQKRENLPVLEELTSNYAALNILEDLRTAAKGGQW